jgi:AcrR family transcriptional regulator
VAAATLRPNQREHILDVALRLMSEHGSAGTSMRLLAKECGLNVAAIYHYFESKGALLAAVIDERRYGARLAEVAPLPPGLSPAERVRHVYHEVWEGALAEEPVVRLLLGEGVRREPSALPVGQGLLATMAEGLEAWLAAELPELAVPPATAAELVVGQLFSGFVRRIFDPALDPAVIERAGAEALVAVLLPR